MQRFVFLASVIALAPAWLPPQAGGADDRPPPPASEPATSDRPIAPWQIDLLELAYESASRFPLDPHVKNRARAQALVVDACLRLDQPRRALRYVEEIPNWRRSVGYADYALYCVEHGDRAEAQRYAEKALEAAAAAIGDTGITVQWQADRAKATVARVQLLLGRLDEAERLGAGLVESEQPAIDAARALTEAEDRFDQRMAALALAVKAGNLDQVRGAVETAGRLHGRYLGDEARCARLQEFIEANWRKMPLTLGVETLMSVARSCLAQAAAERALHFIDLGQQAVESTMLTPDARIPLMARLAALRHAARQHDEARSQVDDALAQFDAERDDIVDVDRAGVLRAVAEAYRAMGLTAEALTVYRKAVAECVVNPNSRPRADDLCAICCSMAVHGVPPDAALGKRLMEIGAALGPPW